MTANPNQRRWRNFLIRRDVQLPIVTTNLIFLGLTCVVLVTVLLSPLYYDLLTADEPWVQQVSGRLFLLLLQRLALAMLLILLFAAVHQVIFSHRFCGPLVNFGHTFEKMARGDFSRKIHLRKRDFLQAEAAQVNAIIDRLNADGSRLDHHLAEIAAGLSHLPAPEDSPETIERIDDLQRSLGTCREIVAGWGASQDRE